MRFLIIMNSCEISKWNFLMSVETKSVSLFPRYCVFAWLLTNTDQLLRSILQPPCLIADISIWKEYVLLSKYFRYYPLFVQCLSSGLTVTANFKISLVFLWDTVKCLEVLIEEAVVVVLPTFFCLSVMWRWRSLTLRFQDLCKWGVLMRYNLPK